MRFQLELRYEETNDARAISESGMSGKKSSGSGLRFGVKLGWDAESENSSSENEVETSNALPASEPRDQAQSNARPTSDSIVKKAPPTRPHTNPLCRVILVEPEIPQNTGNIARTCVGTDSELHLVEPLGFEMSEKRVRRAGLDYWEDLAWQQHSSYQNWRQTVPAGARIFFIETGGDGTIFDAQFRRGDYLVFGKETSGLAPELIASESDARAWSLPMPGKVRSLNLSNAVAVTVFELLRQVQLIESKPS